MNNPKHIIHDSAFTNDKIIIDRTQTKNAKHNIGRTNMMAQSVADTDEEPAYGLSRFAIYGQLLEIGKRKPHTQH